jgi:hypothetical protein
VRRPARASSRSLTRIAADAPVGYQPQEPSASIVLSSPMTFTPLLPRQVRCRSGHPPCGTRGLAHAHTASPLGEGSVVRVSSFLELEAVTKRIERMEPEHALYLVIRARRLMPRLSYRLFNDIEVLHDERQVCLAGGAKIRLDAKKKNGGTSWSAGASTNRSPYWTNSHPQPPDHPRGQAPTPSALTRVADPRPVAGRTGRGSVTGYRLSVVISDTERPISCLRFRCVGRAASANPCPYSW